MQYNNNTQYMQVFTTSNPHLLTIFVKKYSFIDSLQRRNYS
jgi:hypothetical protein